MISAIRPCKTRAASMPRASITASAASSEEATAVDDAPATQTLALGMGEELEDEAAMIQYIDRKLGDKTETRTQV